MPEIVQEVIRLTGFPGYPHDIPKFTPKVPDISHEFFHDVPKISLTFSQDFLGRAYSVSEGALSGSTGTGRALAFQRDKVIPVYDERPKCQIERRKRNLIFISPVSRREREIQNNLSSFEKRKRILSRNFVGNLHFFSVSRRERKF